MKRIAIVCDSITGNTAMLAEALRSNLQTQNVPILSPVQSQTDEYDIYFVGSWTNKGTCSAATAEFLESLSGKKIFLFATCGFGGSKEYFETIMKRFASYVNNTNQIIGSFVCQGKMPESVLDRYEKMKAANPNCVRWDKSIENFQKALTHPNGKDLHDICAAAESAIKNTEI